MKTLYRPLPPIALEEINLFLGEDQEMNTSASISHAVEILRSRGQGSILYLNTVMTPRAMFRMAKSLGLDPSDSGICEIDDDQFKLLHIINVPRGDLHKSREWIDYMLQECPSQFVIVNSWQFAARSSRYREEAIFLLKELTCGMSHEYEPVSVIVYGEESPKKTKKQKVERQGYGKLAGLAKRVECIAIKQEFEASDTMGEKAEMIPQYREASFVDREPSIVEIQNGVTDLLTNDDRRLTIDVIPKNRGLNYSGADFQSAGEMGDEPSRTSAAADQSVLGDNPASGLRVRPTGESKTEVDITEDILEPKEISKLDYAFMRAEENSNSLSAQRYAKLEELDEEIRQNYKSRRDEKPEASSRTSAAADQSVSEEAELSSRTDSQSVLGESPARGLRVRATGESSTGEEATEESITEEASSNLQIHFAPVFIPNRLGEQASDFPHQPIHLNSYGPDKPPVPSSPSPTIDDRRMTMDGLGVHTDVVRK